MTERKLVAAGCALALAGAGVALAISLCFMGEFVGGALWARITLCLGNIAPLPLAWWIGRKLARGTVPIGVLVGGMAAAFAFEAFIYWAAFFGPDSRNVASGLAFFIPVFQLPFLAAIIGLAWFIGRRRTR